MKKFIFSLILTGILALSGCTISSNNTNTSNALNTSNTSNIIENSIIESSIVNDVDESIEFPTTNFEKLQAKFSSIDFTPEDWTTDEKAYIEVNNNKPLFDKDLINTNVFENYSDLDDLGRCGVAFANICTELQPTEKRGSIGMVKPSGWKTSRYDKSVISDMYLYNRCHLIGYQLAGENANEKNLITGTRYLNVTGMLPFEDAVDDYIEDNPNNHVLYRVTPVYYRDDLVARGVLMEAYSVEDNGKLQFCVWCYNVQPGIFIDYKTGDNRLNNTNTKNDTTGTPEASNNTSKITISESENYTYIVNTKTKKIHMENCSAIKDMKEENKEVIHKSIKELENDGYTCCGICKPHEG